MWPDKSSWDRARLSYGCPTTIILDPRNWGGPPEIRYNRSPRASAFPLAVRAIDPELFGGSPPGRCQSTRFGKGGSMASDITLAVGDGAPGLAEVSHGTDPRPPDSVSAETDPTAAIGIQTLSQAVEMLRQDVEHERERGIKLSGKPRKDASGSMSCCTSSPTPAPRR